MKATHQATTARRLRTLALTLALLLVLLLPAMTACAGGETAYDSAEYDKDMHSDYAASGEAGKVNGMTGVPSSDMAAEDQSAEEYASKVIRTVTMRAETKAFDAALTALETLTADCGGYVESSNVRGAGYEQVKGFSRSAEYVFRIPADKLNSFLSEAGTLCVVTSRNATSDNVTTTYYDIRTRLETLRSEQQSLQAMLEKADTIEHMLTVKERLYDVIYEIESYETQLRLLDSRVAYSTVHLTLAEVIEYTEIPSEEDSWGARLAEAFSDSWRAFGNGFQNFTVFFVAAFPTLLVLGGIAAVVIVIVVKINKKHSPKQEKPKDGE